MNPTVHGPEYTVAMLAATGVGVLAAARFLRWLFSGPVTPDPWDTGIRAQLEEAEAMPVCHRCLTEHSDLAHFCPQCGAAVGDYNNLLPFEWLFSEGEVMRNGTTLKVRRGFLTIAGYILLPLTVFFLLAPVYWFFFLRNLWRGEPEAVDSNA